MRGCELVDHTHHRGFPETCAKMERVLLLLLFFSSSLCAGNYTYLGSASLAVCQPDTCALISEVAAMREKLAAMTQKQSTPEENLGDMMQKMANVEANQ